MICEEAEPLSKFLYDPTAFYMQLLHVLSPAFCIAYVDSFVICEHELSFFLCCLFLSFSQSRYS